MAKTNPEIEIWMAECAEEETARRVAEICRKVSGCLVIFEGRDDSGNYVVIHSVVGPALKSRALRAFGKDNFPAKDRLLTTFRLLTNIAIEQSEDQ